MTILSQENPVILLLENMLEALSTAPDNINNERRRRRYLLNWLDTARQMREFRGMAEEFTTPFHPAQNRARQRDCPRQPG